MDKLKREAEALAHLTYKPHRFGDQAAWFAASVELAERALVAEQWKAYQLKVESTWDPQEVAKELGLPLGTDIRAGILPAIKVLNTKFENHIKTVGEFLSEMYATMVDPLDDHNMKVKELCALLLQRAREDREKLRELQVEHDAHPSSFRQMGE